MKIKLLHWTAVLGGSCLLSISASAWARNDVLVVVNDNSTDSLAVGAYYAQQRGILASNIVHVRAPLIDLVSWTDFASLRNQILKNGLCPLSPNPPSECSGSVASMYTQNAIDTLVATTPIHYIVLTKGLPARMWPQDLNATRTGYNFEGVAPDLIGTDSNGNKVVLDTFNPWEPATVDAYLRISLANYMPVDDYMNRSLRSGKYVVVDADSGVSYADKSTFTAALPSRDREFILGRLDGVTLASAKSLVDKAIAGEAAGLLGKAYIDVPYAYYPGVTLEMPDTTGSLTVNPARGESFSAQNSDLLAAFNLFGESTLNECRNLADPGFYLNYQASLAAGKTPPECTVAFDNDSGIGPAGNPQSRQPSVVSPWIYLGYLDGQQAPEFSDWLNWHKTPSCTSTLCATASDAAACQAASTDPFQEIDTRCVGVAPGAIGANQQSFPVSHMGAWPTGWQLPTALAENVADIPRVDMTNGYNDSVSIVYDRPDEVASPTCVDISSGSDAQTACPSPRTINIGQTADWNSVPGWNHSAASYDMSFAMRYDSGTASGASVKMTLVFQKSPVNGSCAQWTGWVLDAWSGNCQYTAVIAVPIGSGSMGWTKYARTVALPSIPAGGVDSMQTNFSGSVMASAVALDAVSVKQTGTSLELVQHGNFDGGHLQTSFGDYATNFLDRLGGVAFWGSGGHHGSAGYALQNHGVQSRLFLWGLPLGDAVWFGENLNTGMLIGDPLYNPVGTSISPLAAPYGQRLNNLSNVRFTITAHNGQAREKYQWALCHGHTPASCDAANLWSPLSSWFYTLGQNYTQTISLSSSQLGAGGEYWIKLNAQSNAGQHFYDIYGFTAKYTDAELQATGGAFNLHLNFANQTPYATASYGANFGGATLTLAGSTKQYSVTTDAFGNGRINAGILGGSYVLTAVSPVDGHSLQISSDSGATWNSAVSLSLPSVGSVNLFAREAPQVVDGYVRDMNGQPIPGLGMTLLTKNGGQAIATTNVSGYYQLPLASGDSVAGLSVTDYLLSTPFSPVFNSSGSSGLSHNFNLQGGFVFGGRVVDESNLPVAGAGVSLSACNAACTDMGATAYTNANGYFTIPVSQTVTGAAFTVNPYPGDGTYPDFTIVSAPLSVQTGGASFTYVVHRPVVSTASPGFIAGFCTLSSGFGATGATVSLYDATQQTLYAQTSPQVSGFYKFKGVVPGNYTVVFTMPNATTSTQSVQVADKAVLEVNALMPLPGDSSN